MCLASISKPIDIGTIYSNTKRGQRGGKIRRIQTQITHDRKTIRHKTRGVNPNNNIEIKRKEYTNFQFPNVYLANARSINNKKDDLSCEIKANGVDIAVITETWLKENTPNEPLAIQGYDLMRKDRTIKRGGGVCVLTLTVPLHKALDKFRKWKFRILVVNIQTCQITTRCILHEYKSISKVHVINKCSDPHTHRCKG